MKFKNQSLYFADITAIAGKGGNGKVSFIRNAFIAKGGPDGGNGGSGGSVYIRGKSNLTSLTKFQYQKIWKADNGSDGGNLNKTGRTGLDEVIEVPIGTSVFTNNEKLFDITKENEIHIVASGGNGGYGNKYFTTPELTAPHIATKGQLGQEVNLKLILKYMADIGVIGMPNAGKSTFVGRVSKAKVKIGDYDFTTIEPIIGTFYHNNIRITIADLPGLIEGASDGKGLGYLFLQHLERCRILLHFIDISNDNFEDSFRIIQNEIRNYDAELLKKEYCICLTKIDLIDEHTLQERLVHISKKGYQYFIIKEDIKDLFDYLVEAISKQTDI